uniref:Ig-like domain-containing protein n=1 Tax=Paramormyrops kingsleyae TaxID=1676925 RepID=A0A3B3RXH5_9TELE
EILSIWIFECLFSVSVCLGVSTGVLPSALDALRQVLPGSTVALPCNFTIPSEITWIRQRSEEITMLGDTKTTLGNATVDTFNEGDRFTTIKDNRTGLINLWIKEVSEADLGIYFCSVRHHGRLVFGSGEHLTFSVAPQFAVFAAGPTSQTSFPVCWTLLAAVTPAGSLLIALLVYKLCHPAGKRRVSKHMGHILIMPHILGVLTTHWGASSVVGSLSLLCVEF